MIHCITIIIVINKKERIGRDYIILCKNQLTIEERKYQAKGPFNNNKGMNHTTFCLTKTYLKNSIQLHSQYCSIVTIAKNSLAFEALICDIPRN